jgi:hypothetical protein
MDYRGEDWANAPEEGRGGWRVFGVAGGVVVGLLVGVCLCVIVAGLVVASGIGYLGSGDWFDTTGGGTISFGQSVTEQIYSDVEAHDWTFEGTQGDQVEIWVVGDGASDPRARLIGPNDNLIARDDDGGGDLDSYISASLPRTGTYTIRIDMFEPGSYTLSLN